MKNSLLPLGLLLLTVAAAVALLRGGVERGQDGPAIHAGIVRLPARESRRMKPAVLSGTTSASGAAVGCGAWRVLVLAADDNAPATRACLLALGELVAERGGIAILDPLPGLAREPSEPLPLGADGRIAVRTATAALPGRPGGACSLELALRVQVPGPPDGHPARAAGDPAWSEAAWTVRHRSEGPDGTWPAWWAGLGRACAEALVGRLGLAADLSDVDRHVAAAVWSGGNARLPQPPGCDELRWLACFQTPQRRGWLGRMASATSSDRVGRPVSSLSRLEPRLQRGGWIEAPAPAPGAYRWQRPADGLLARLDALPEDGGWRLVWWQERP